MLLMLSNFFFWPGPMDWQMNQQDVVIRGTVVDEATGRAVPGATVYAASPAFDARTVSDSNGEFIFLTLFPGTYRLCASKTGYALDCHPRDSQPPELFAGFEYGATVVLSHATN
ncbi:MAG: carboxypeptidase regulatory-like domain-containing protein [Candidatus Eremiobacteraeota bacterium]|nr:carboxypeptidase regulatory-like domain-containing protein [Candidatus Eremiobacteraeota bacterium]